MRLEDVVMLKGKGRHLGNDNRDGFGRERGRGGKHVFDHESVLHRRGAGCDGVCACVLIALPKCRVAL